MAFADQPAPHGATKIDYRAGENKPYVHQSYPSCRYHPDGSMFIARNEEQDKSCPPPWRDTPYPQPEKAAPPPPPTYDELKRSHLDLTDRNAGLEVLIQDLRKENEGMRLYILEIQTSTPPSKKSNKKAEAA